MKIVSKISDLAHPYGISTGYVPTMGAFHEGHMQLMRTARAENERVVVSLFVNPTQFGKGEDFEKYPRDLDRDLSMAEQVGVDVMFTPPSEEIYPRPGSTIHVPVVADLWEGAVRPTHFDGVATVVCKLFNIIRCDVAYFGQKDLQQCIVVNRMIEDLNMPVRFSRQPTVREADGLAMSSRNVYLSSGERRIAPLLFSQLGTCKESLLGCGADEIKVGQSLSKSFRILEDAGFKVDYLDLIEIDSARPTRDFSRPSAIIAAVRLGNTRLIDNILM